MATDEVDQVIGTGNDKEANNNRATWNELQRAFLVELLVELDKPGYRQQNGWSNAAWNEITRRFRAKYPNANFSVKQIKEQEHTLKKQYKTIKQLREKSGFGWDPIKNMVFAPEEVWAPLMHDRDIRRWYNKSFPYYDDLHKLYSDSIATGSRRKGSYSIINRQYRDLRVESSSPTVSATGQARLFESDDEVLNTQPAELSISTPPQNISTPQESPSFQPTTSIQNPFLGKSKNVRKRKAISSLQERRDNSHLCCNREEFNEKR